MLSEELRAAQQAGFYPPWGSREETVRARTVERRCSTGPIQASEPAGRQPHQKASDPHLPVRRAARVRKLKEARARILAQRHARHLDHGDSVFSVPGYVVARDLVVRAASDPDPGRIAEDRVSEDAGAGAKEHKDPGAPVVLD